MENLIKTEVELIANPKIKQFTYGILSKAPTYFWKIPSSSSGKYHPADENGVGGLVLHVRRAAKIAEDLCRNFEVEGDDRDCVIAATIIHDCVKNGYPDDSTKTVTGHGALLCLLIGNYTDGKAVTEDRNLKTIMRLACNHMGKWDFPYSSKRDIMEIIIAASDYVSSRNYIQINV